MLRHTTYVTTIISEQKPEALAAFQNGDWAWVEEGVALDIYHDDVRDWPELDAVDIITQRNKQRHKTLLLADMDSTLIKQECIDEMAAELGIKEQISHITARAMNGEIGFEEALAERVSLLKGLTEADLQQVYDKRITLMPGATVLAATMKAHHAHLAIVSGGFTFFTDRVMRALGFDEAHSNELMWDKGALTGMVSPPIFGQESKRERLLSLQKERDLKTDSILAIGDGANDIPMLKAAGLGVACHAKPAVQQQVSAKINHHDLSALLYVQGISRQDWQNIP